MAKISRPDKNVAAFGSQATGTSRTIFGSETQSDDLTDNLNTDFEAGWNTLGIKPPRQWENGAKFTMSQLIAYLFQMGISEWNTNQEYHLNSRTIGSDGIIYKSLSNNNIGNNPTSDIINWKIDLIDIASLTDKTTPVDADTLAIADSAASNILKKLTFANLKATLKTYFDTLYNLYNPTPTIATGTATFTATTNNINLTGVGIGVEIGDVIQISGATDSKNNSEFTVEVITDDDNIIVNQAHANKGTTKNVAARASDTGVTVKLLAKWYNASNTLGRLVTSMRTVRTYNTDYVNNTGRDMDITFASSSAATGLSGLYISVNGTVSGYSQIYATSADTASTSSMMPIPKGATYRFVPSYNVAGNPIVFEIR